MTQLQFEIICEILERGAPVLARELISSLDYLVRERNALAEEVTKYKEREQNIPCENTDNVPNS